MKTSFLFITILFSSFIASSQDCSVETEALKGTYSGGCKNGKANGKGKAVGTDTYEGNFAAGIPNGEGNYRWSNGNEYKGFYVKGTKDGWGKLIYKRPNQTDSVLEGLWKKDVYMGKPKDPYRLIFQSKLITEVEAEKRNSNFNRITFYISCTSCTARTLEGDEFPKMKVDEVQMLSGTMGRLYYNNESTGKKTESVIENVSFPARMKLIIGQEELEIEFMEAGEYVVNVRINN